MNRLLPILMAFVLAVLAAPSIDAQAQSPLTRGAGDPDTQITIPADLSPDMVDGMLARMTDAEIRALLRDELVRRAEEEITEDTGLMMTFQQIETRLTEMAANIERRVSRWSKALRNLGQRKDQVAERLATAQSGVRAMLLAGLFVLAAGIIAGCVSAWMIRSWRRWLMSPARDNYWDRVVRTITLGVVDLFPIAAFILVTGFLVPYLQDTLGPLAKYNWIYQTGVSYSWAFIVFTRRAFAPDAPAIRIAPLGDRLAARLHGLLRLAVCIGAAGWLIGGLLFHFGLGFPPVMVLRALAGTTVAAVLLIGLWRMRHDIQQATSRVFDAGTMNGSLARIVVAAAPGLFAAYIIAAWLYWLAHWLEGGGDQLAGPAGTLVIYLALPIFDRMGCELISSIIRKQTDLADRFRTVFFGAWRIFIGFVAALVIAWLWGINILALAKGADAPTWASTVFDVIVTVLLGYLIWRLIAAALYTERKVSSAAEDVDPSTVPAASRLNTLIPLFRNFMLGFLAIVITMIVLSAVGVDIGPLIASAGIIGIAIGFGAQSLVRDVFSGIFFLVDDAFRVGEYIELDADLRGEVESISIRSLQLRHHRGPVITIPFGELKQITNHNRDWCIYKMSFRMEPETDPQKFKKLVKNVGKEFLAHPDHGPKFLEPLKSQGVYYVDDDSALVMRVKFKCKPRAQFVLRREIYHRLRAVFAENELYLARRKVEVVGGGRRSDARR